MSSLGPHRSTGLRITCQAPAAAASSQRLRPSSRISRCRHPPRRLLASVGEFTIEAEDRRRAPIALVDLVQALTDTRHRTAYVVVGAPQRIVGLAHPSSIGVGIVSAAATPLQPCGRGGPASL